MYRLLSICIILCCAIGLRTANAQSCCEYTGDFAMLAMNDEFKASHADPLPLNYAPDNGETITFETLDGTKGRAFYVPSDQPTNKVILMFHEWWGLNDYIRREAERWQDMLGNVDIYAIDLYDGKVATTAEEASKLSSGVNKKRAENIIKGVLQEVGMDKLVGTIGWCFGGSWAFNASLLAGNQSKATVMYYGFPETDTDKVMKVQNDILYLWASRDNHITRDVVTTFGKKVEDAGHDFTMHTFDAVHAFANPSNPNHDALAAAQAELLAKKFLQEKLQLK